MRVMYIDGEMPAVTMQERLAAIVNSHEAEAEADALLIVTPDMQDGEPMPDLSTIEGQAAIAPLLEGVRLIVVDNISTLCRTGTENESDSWDVVQMWALKQHSAGRSVLFVHHAGKTGAQRGTSKREDVLDTVIALRRPGDYTWPGRVLRGSFREGADSAATKPSRCFAPWTKTNTAKPPGHGESWNLPPLTRLSVWPMKA